jgi:hypothetical protein
MMNFRDRTLTAADEAVLEYQDGDYRIVRAGRYVVCGVTGDKILLEDLRYWSVDLQEPYASTDAVLQRLREGQKA